MSSLLLRMCILNYPVWTCPENSHEHHFALWFLFCGRLVSTFYDHCDHRTRFSYSPQFWLNYLWSVQLFGSLDSPVFLQLSIIVLVVILKLASHVHVSTCLYLVIFFPLSPASLMHKNPQDQGSTLRPMGSPMRPAFTQWRPNFHAWSPTWPPR